MYRCDGVSNLMYILIVNEDTTSENENVIAERIREAVHKAAPDIQCRIISDKEVPGTSVELAEPSEHTIRVQCFGEFEVFGRERPLEFKRAKTKELFAVLVCHRGSMLSMGTIMSILWEDGEDSDSDRSYLRTMISDLKKTLSGIGAEDVVIKKYNSIGIDTTKIDCDYYDFLDGKWEAVQQYNGQFMRQYPWAEYELSRI